MVLKAAVSWKKTAYSLDKMDVDGILTELTRIMIQ